MHVHCVCAHGHSFSLRLVPYFLEQMIGNAQYVFLRTQTFIYSHGASMRQSGVFLSERTRRAFIRRRRLYGGMFEKRILNNS